MLAADVYHVGDGVMYVDGDGGGCVEAIPIAEAISIATTNTGR